MEDDFYEGMFIPKGTWVRLDFDSVIRSIKLMFSKIIGNIWAISRNAALYPDPHAFRPERFLVEVDAETRKRMDPRSYVFGGGRRYFLSFFDGIHGLTSQLRRCPGVPLIHDGLWLMIARIVATLDIKKTVVNGVPVDPQPTYDNAFLR
jgi:cytochrome P450